MYSDLLVKAQFVYRGSFSKQTELEYFEARLVNRARASQPVSYLGCKSQTQAKHMIMVLHTHVKVPLKTDDVFGFFDEGTIPQVSGEPLIGPTL